MKKNKRNLIAFIGCLVFTIIIFVGLVSFQHSLNEKEPTDKVVIAKKNIENINTLVDKEKSPVEDYFEVVEMNKNLIPENSYSSLDELKGIESFYINCKMSKNETLTHSKITTINDIKLTYKDRVETGFKVSSYEDAVCGTIRSGDKISITVVSSTGMQKNISSSAYVSKVTTSDGKVISNNDTTSIATGFIVWMESTDMPIFNENITKGTIIVARVDK